ncbi:putative zinc finger protein [Melghirimyces profundicolus]|uniref:Anti-sigma-W factor RsiW n=1 Tax=Melghirimyces profundicolus TaxID=1242148 RepID=A0A2T6C946_9BACL|nr:zf-HC2 domain-containing protein [Melghirimyces profundicolus]PTX64832.1 putative zinc finger protein [Melghirimyces profundicolus]
MSCGKWLEWIQRDLDGDLSPEERGELRRHLAGCPACAEFAGRLRKIDETLSELPRPAPPVSPAERALREIEGAGPAERKSRRKKTPGRKTWRVLSLATAAAAILAAIGLAVDRRDPAPGIGSAGSNPSLQSSESVSPQKEKAMTDRFPSGEEVPSPDGRLIARITENRVVVRDRKGEVRYRSPSREPDTKIRIRWKDKETLWLRYDNGTERTVMIPVRK